MREPLEKESTDSKDHTKLELYIQAGCMRIAWQAVQQQIQVFASWVKREVYAGAEEQVQEVSANWH